MLDYKFWKQKKLYFNEKKYCEIYFMYFKYKTFSYYKIGMFSTRELKG